MAEESESMVYVRKPEKEGRGTERKRGRKKETEQENYVQLELLQVNHNLVICHIHSSVKRCDIHAHCEF